MAPATNTSTQATDNSVGNEHEVNTTQESEKQRLEREEKDRLRKQNLEKESVSKVLLSNRYMSSKNMPKYSLNIGRIYNRRIIIHPSFNIAS